jgi:hypothetical protein
MSKELAEKIKYSGKIRGGKKPTHRSTIGL